MNLVDHGAGGQDHLDTPAANVHHRRGAPFEIEVAGGAAEGQLTLFFT
jgi:hypothetical protein